MSKKRPLHPCQSCGACCASYRVSFHWREAEADTDDINDHSVPQDFTEDLDLNRRCMKGTNQKHKPTCIALLGRVGESVQCVIYHNRPSPCRIFSASFESGEKNERCDEARAKHGLSPLTKNDFLALKPISSEA
jgi:Fe-S-cluster containining protein